MNNVTYFYTILDIEGYYFVVQNSFDLRAGH
jgi:hypothetical protein